jgi:hypothetical protein
MHWSDVWNIASRLPSGKAYVFSENEIREAAQCQLDSTFDRVRRSDIIDFTNNLKDQLNVIMQENPMNGSWTMRRL